MVCYGLCVLVTQHLEDWIQAVEFIVANTSILILPQSCYHESLRSLDIVMTLFYFEDDACCTRFMQLDIPFRCIDAHLANASPSVSCSVLDLMQCLISFEQRSAIMQVAYLALFATFNNLSFESVFLAVSKSLLQVVDMELSAF